MDLLKPTIRQIRYFVAVAEALSFRRAAARLQVSQPTLSHQILALEEAFGLQLFERSRAGTKLTPAARELLPNSRRVLEEFQGLCDQTASVARGPAGTYRLGVTPTLGPYLLPHVLPGIHRRYAALKLYVREDAPRNLEVGLGAGEYDLILTPLPVDQIGLTVVPLFLEPLKLVMSAEHRLAKKRRIGRGDLAGESVLTIEEHHHFHKQVQQLCARLKAQTLRDYEGTSLDTLRQMVVMGMGIAFLPALYVRSEIHRPGELRVTTVHGEEIYRTHALAWRSSSPSRQLFQAIAREIRSVVARDLSKEVKPVPRRRRAKSATA
ncbi:MAG: hydrogen peroxide-inducible genes activator [Deltaproteobacteria bacterium]|nr:hydrogen peroxide-inducible genes activator [Deltaproteobacteria bacterium]